MNRWEKILEELERLHGLEDRWRQGALLHLRETGPREMGFAAVLEETLLRGQEDDAEVSASVRAWRWGEELPPISEPAQIWRFVRVSQALTWLTLTLGSPGWERVMGEPLLTDEEVIQWLLTDWWQLGGAYLRAMWEMGG